MSLFSTFECQKCGHCFESCLDICAKCGGLAMKVSGIRACLDSGRPPGYAGGKNKPYSARSYDRCMEKNFEVLKITDCHHKEGPNGEKIPVCSFSDRPQLSYNSAPNATGGNSFPIKAYHSMGEMGRDLSKFAGHDIQVPMTVDGKQFQTPNVHPEFPVGTQFSARRPQTTLKDRTVIVARHTE